MAGYGYSSGAWQWSSRLATGSGGTLDHRPPADPVVGCGAWSAPLLLLAGQASAVTRTWAVAFYVMALAFN